MIERLCKDCGDSFQQYNTTQTICQKCAYNRYNKPQKPIKRVGPKTKKWFNHRANWLKKNPPDHQGYYTCWICGGQVHIDEVTLDHVQPRSGLTSHLVFVDSNLKPAHSLCNNNKGSKRI